MTSRGGLRNRETSAAILSYGARPLEAIRKDTPVASLAERMFEAVSTPEAEERPRPLDRTYPGASGFRSGVLRDSIAHAVQMRGRSDDETGRAESAAFEVPAS